jgi:hypothetical protein
MVFLLDESNIHKADGISSVALIHVAGLEQLSILDAHVLETERALKIEPFHWAKSNWAVREKFFRAILKVDFRVRVALLVNPIHIEAAIEEVLSYLITERNVLRLIVDGSKPREYSSRLKKVLRNEGITVKKLRNEADHARPTLRIADCVAGLVRHHAEKPTGRSASLYRELRPRIDATVEI